MVKPQFILQRKNAENILETDGIGGFVFYCNIGTPQSCDIGIITK
jgi:hypothetical protein